MGHNNDNLISQEEIKELLDYNPETGELHWKHWRPGVRKDMSAGCLRDDGYIQLIIGHRTYRAHRLAWMYVHGRWPDGDIDHVNMNRSDNRLANLREASRSQNVANSRARANNPTGLKGVSFCKRKGKFRSQIKIKGRQKFLGHFNSAEDAHAAYVKAANDNFGEFAMAS